MFIVDKFVTGNYLVAIRPGNGRSPGLPSTNSAWTSDRNHISMVELITRNAKTDGSVPINYYFRNQFLFPLKVPREREEQKEETRTDREGQS